MPFNTLRGYLHALAELLPGKVALTLALMLGLSFTEGIGLLMLVPMLQLIGLDTGQGPMGQVETLVSSFFGSLGMGPTLPAILAAYVAVVAVHALFHRLQAETGLSLQQEFVGSLRRRLYGAITHMDWLHFARSRSSDFVHALTTELDRVGNATHYLLLLLVNTFVVFVYLLFSLRVSPLMTGVVLVCGGVLLVALRGKTRSARLSGEEISLAGRGLYAAATEHLGGMKTVKSYGSEKRNAGIFSDLIDRLASVYVGAARRRAEAKFWFDIGAVMMLSLTLYISLEYLGLQSAEILLLLFVYARTIPRLSSAQQSYQHLMSMLPAFEAVRKVQAQCEAGVESAAQNEEEVEFGRTLELRQVSFHYGEDGSKPVLSRLNLLVRKGQTTAIMGVSGAGKSTVADLVLGLLQPTRGKILVDDRPLTPSNLRSWRRQIGYVGQETFLFHDTVKANLLWACPRASDEDIRQALILAAAEDFVDGLPQGMDTILGDRAVGLSGGEKQRLALARALLRQPALLIMDEATSALDSENEQRILAAIANLSGGMTILIISHRLSAVRDADVVQLLEDGRLVESQREEREREAFEPSHDHEL